MRIAHLLWSFSTGGVETMLVDIMNEQVKHCKVKVYIVNKYYDKDLLNTIDRKIEVTLINRAPGRKLLWPFIKLNLKLMLFHPNVIHCHRENLAPIIKLPFKKVLTIHNTHSKSDNFGKYARLFCISNAVKEHTAQQGFSDGIVVYNGIHTDGIAVKDYSKASVGGKKRIVCVGRLNKDKGQRVLIDAANELVNIRHLIGFSIDFIGDGEDRNELERLVDVYSLRGYVNFLGKKPRSWFYPRLKDYDLYVMPSISEGFGLTLAEACAAKLPVLTCDLAGPMEVINGSLGLSFRTGNITSLADSIAHFLHYGVDRNMVEAAYKYIKENFDVITTSERYIEEYLSLCRN